MLYLYALAGRPLAADVLDVLEVAQVDDQVFRCGRVGWVRLERVCKLLAHTSDVVCWSGGSALGKLQLPCEAGTAPLFVWRIADT